MATLSNHEFDITEGVTAKVIDYGLSAIVELSDSAGRKLQMGISVDDGADVERIAMALRDAERVDLSTALAAL